MLIALCRPNGSGQRLPDRFICPACGGDDLGVLSFNDRPYLGAEEGVRIQHSDCEAVFEVVADGLRVLDDVDANATLEGNW